MDRQDQILGVVGNKGGESRGGVLEIGDDEMA